MRCPLCGADNADNQLTCWSCGAWLPTRRVEDQVDQMMERLSAAASEQAERESLLIHALDEVVEERPDISWLEDAESRLLTSRNAGDTMTMRLNALDARTAAAAAARRASDLDARAAAFVSSAYETIEFPPVGTVSSPRSNPAASQDLSSRKYESSDASGRTRRTRREAGPGAAAPSRGQRVQGRGPRFRSIVPLVASDDGSRPQRRKRPPVEPELPAYAAETMLDTDPEAARVVPTEPTSPHRTGKMPRIEPEPTSPHRTGKMLRIEPEPTREELEAAAEDTGVLRGDAADEQPASTFDRAEQPFGAARNMLVEDSPFEAFPEGVSEETEDDAWEEPGDELPEEPLESRPLVIDELAEDAPEQGLPARVSLEDAVLNGLYEQIEDGSLEDVPFDELPSDEELERELARGMEPEAETEDETAAVEVTEYDELVDQDELETEYEPELGDEPEPEIEEEYEPELEEELIEPDEASEDEALAEDVPDETEVRPVPSGVQEPLNNGGHFVIRNTRDYDHDAQSTNLVNAGDQFDTLTESRDARKLRNDPYARSKRRGYVPGEGNSRGLLRPFLAVLLVALVLCGGGAVLTYGLEMWGGKSVPLVTGYQQASAEQRLVQKGFFAVIKPEPADDAIGIVTRQSPEPGTRAPEGSEIVLYVATNRTVPDVMGLTEAEARTVLEKSGAENIVSVVESSTEPEGTVIGVEPGVGEPFVSRVELKLIIAGPYIVPDVLTKKEQDAIEAIEKAGFVANVTYVYSDQTVRTVVETIPAAGTAYEKGGTVEVHVSAPYPSDPYHLAEFFDHSSQDDNDFLLKQGYSFEGGGIESGQALAIYTSSESGNIAFSSMPHAHQLKVAKKDDANALASGNPFSAVRLDLPSWYAPGAFDESSLQQIAELCGFSGLTDSCNNLTLTLPSGETRLEVPFGCISGTMGDLVWTVLVIGGDTPRVSATCAKEVIYVPSELLGFGGNVSQYAAYQEVYASKEFEPKPDPKQEEGKDADKKDGDNKDAEKKEGEGTDASADANAGAAGNDATGEQHDGAVA